MTTTPSTLNALALSISTEFDRSKLPRGQESFARLRIHVPAAQASISTPRRGLALAIALDCSGSMSEPAGAPDGSPMQFGLRAFGSMASHKPADSKIERCKSAIWEAVSLLGPDDMASLSAFASMAQTIFPMAPMTDANKVQYKAALDKMSASGGTALHAGWSEAGKQAAKGIDRKLLCRVALLTDGEATDGERNPDALAAQSATLAGLGVSTSCFGVGARFNEDLLCAMADAGEGNFRYIPDAMLANAAAVDEVNGLGATAGRKAKLLVTGEGFESIEILNTFDKDGDWLRLPTLLAGRPIEAAARIRAGSAPSGTLRAEVQWENRDGIVQSCVAEASIEFVEADEAAKLPQDPEVAGAAAALLAAQAKNEMAAKISLGDIAGATACLESARGLLSTTAAYSGSAMEMQSLNTLSASLSSGDFQSTRKTAIFQSYTRSKNQTISTGADQEPAKKDTP